MSDLAAYQDALLQHLWEGTLLEALESLDEHPALAPFADYLETLDPRAVEVACEVVRKWARPRELP